MDELMNVKSEKFEVIFKDIKDRYLSKTNFPKLIIGTGLSISMGIPGMEGLSDKLNEEFEHCNDDSLVKLWQKYKDRIKDGLEAALADISSDDEPLVEAIRVITSEYILNKEHEKHSDILSKMSGLERLLKYLQGTVSVNYPVIDIMTPNYDRVIELVCDKLKIASTLGFAGNMYQSFNENILRKPHDYYSKNITLVRLFKPHGSLNWIKKGDKEYQVNDYEYLKRNKQYIDIIAPGGMKYKSGMLNSTFRCHREIFNELITDARNSFSLFIYGYGFNDQHFNIVFEDTQKDVIVLSKTIKSDIINKVLKNENWTLFYAEDKSGDENTSRNYMIYRCRRYEIDRDLWDLGVFTDVFLGR